MPSKKLDAIKDFSIGQPDSPISLIYGGLDEQKRFPIQAQSCVPSNYGHLTTIS